jgi:hypothetical protein
VKAQPSTVERAGAEQQRLAEARERGVLWQKWGSYLSQRQWVKAGAQRNRTKQLNPLNVWNFKLKGCPGFLCARRP